MNKYSFDTDILVIGAGVIGLAVAREMATIGLSIIVVEKNIWTKSPLRNLETREIKILFSDSSISRLYAVRLSPSNFRSRIYLQKDKNFSLSKRIFSGSELPNQIIVLGDCFFR